MDELDYETLNSRDGEDTIANNMGIRIVDLTVDDEENAESSKYIYEHSNK